MRERMNGEADEDGNAKDWHNNVRHENSPTSRTQGAG